MVDGLAIAARRSLSRDETVLISTAASRRVAESEDLKARRSDRTATADRPACGSHAFLTAT